MDNKELVKDGRILALKIIAESFILSKETDVIDTMFPKSIDRESLELTNGDALVLHHWLAHEHARLGLDLNTKIEENGEKVTPGQLSEYEIKMLIEKADELLVMMRITKQYVDAK